ncbi:MAG: hypothetical protein RBT01_12020 [Anaerolineaceae bacterium]|nr:hypothetical protein [Anaerolineaceae bacterium]
MRKVECWWFISTLSTQPSTLNTIHLTTNLTLVGLEWCIALLMGWWMAV